MVNKIECYHQTEVKLDKFNNFIKTTKKELLDTLIKFLYLILIFTIITTTYIIYKLITWKQTTTSAQKMDANKQVF